MDLQEEFTQIMKGKRTKRPRQSSPLALTMAASTSSSSMAEGRGGIDVGAISDNSGVGGGGSGGGSSVRPSTASTTNSGEVYTDRSIEEEEDMANCLILLAQGNVLKTRSVSEQEKGPDRQPLVPTTYYQCKTCDRCFPSFQALGGHRASHNKPNKADEKIKPSTTLKQETDQDQENSTTTSTTLSLQIVSNNSRVSPRNSSSNAKSRVHECSTCGAEFSSGQALGGHMRRHRSVSIATSSGTTGGDLDSTRDVKKSRNNVLALDLNQLPAPEDEHRDSKFVFASKKQVIVFSASSLVDCQY